MPLQDCDLNLCSFYQSPYFFKLHCIHGSYRQLLRKQMFRSATKCSHIQVFVHPVELSVFDMHRKADRDGNFCSRRRRSSNCPLLWSEGSMQVLDADLIFGAKGIRKFHVKIFCVNSSSH